MANQETKSPATTEGSSGQVAPRQSDLPVSDLRREIDRVFEDFFSGGARGWPWGRSLQLGGLRDMAGRAWGAAPSVDVNETDKAYEIEAELPGMDDKDIELSLNNGVLTLKGERRQETEDKEKHLSERRYGSFQRSFTLPDSVDPEKATAEFRKGVLKVSLPKRPEAHKPVRKIAIKSA